MTLSYITNYCKGEDKKRVVQRRRLPIRIKQKDHESIGYTLYAAYKTFLVQKKLILLHNE